MSDTGRWTEEQKRTARKMLQAARRNGELVCPPECEECGRTNCRISGHHDDYDKPMSVRWLCGFCHEEAHKAMRRNGLLPPHPRDQITSRGSRGDRVTTYAAAKVLGCTSADVRRLVSAGELTGRRFGYRVWVDWHSLAHLVRARAA